MATSKSHSAKRNKLTIHMTGNAHLDPVWLWNWQEGYQEARATFRSALDRMKETPEFVFTCSQPALLKWIEEADPAMFREIRKRVREGRWCMVGGWWMEPDCNIPSGESFVRQALVGQLYLKEKFGKMATVGYNVDSFGHAWTLPQLLAGAGMNAYTFKRPDAHENPDMPAHIYWWESPDGTRVLTFRIAFTYSSWGGELEEHVRRALTEAAPGVDHFMVYYGVGNHGGGPTKENIASIERLQKDLDEANVVFSSPDEFFHKVRGQRPHLPTWRDEMQHHASGCYAAHSEVHANNRKAEHALLTAESFSAMAAALLDAPYPAEQLRSAWENVLYCQFHDIMGGTSIPAAYDEVRNMHGESLAIAARHANFAYQRLTSQVDTRGEGKPLFLFNALAWPRKAVVEIDDGGPTDKEYTLLDEGGSETPAQWTHPETAVGRGRYVAVVDLPALGYKRFWVRREKPALLPSRSDALRASGLRMENRFLRVRVNAETGLLESLYDKRLKAELLSSDAAVPIVLDDPSDTWSHGVFRFREEIGRFKVESAELVESGPVRALIRVLSRWDQSTLRQDFMLYRDVDALLVRAYVHWRQKQKMLKLAFPVAVVKPTATYSIPYGFIHRPADGEEEPGQQWIDVSGKLAGSGRKAGLALLNDAKYSYDIEGSEMRLTVLRSPVYSHHDPHTIDADKTYCFQDQGPQTLNYALVPHSGDWRGADAVKRSDELNVPVHFQFEHQHAGDVPGTMEFLSVKSSSVVASVLKQSEDGKDLIVRAFETQGQKAMAEFKLPTLGRTWSATFSPCSVKTFRVALSGRRRAIQTDLLERPLR